MNETSSSTRRRPPGASGPFALAAALTAAVMVSAIHPLGCTTSDQFECGLPVEGTPDKPARCDRTGEVCVCHTNRCATAAFDCDSAYRYVFGARECVDAGDAPSVLVSSGDDDGFCPGAGPRSKPCGVVGGSACRADEVCVCAATACATLDRSCASAYRYSLTGNCVEEGDARPETLLFGADGSTYCPGQGPPEPPCGVYIPQQDVGVCAAPQRCVCAEQSFHCAYPTPSCPSGWAWSADRTCVQLDQAIIEDPANTADPDSGICPSPKDGGAGDAVDGGDSADGGAGGSSK